jgi:nicotinamide-nucleotide amidase
MAAGVRRKTGATYGLSVTGNAGPGVDSGKEPVGKVFVGLADTNGVTVVDRQFFGDRPRIRSFAGQMALDCLRRRLTCPAL